MSDDYLNERNIEQRQAMMFIILDNWPKDSPEPNWFGIMTAVRGWGPLPTGQTMYINSGGYVYAVKKEGKSIFPGPPELIPLEKVLYEKEQGQEPEPTGTPPGTGQTTPRGGGVPRDIAAKDQAAKTQTPPGQA